MSEPKAADSITQKLDELFKPWNRDDAPGLTVGVSHKGKVIYRAGFGLASIEHARALTPETRMRIGSTTKHFCCLGIMLLAEDGKLDIDSPVGEYLPELGALNGKPTLLQLMRHTGGLHDAMIFTLMQGGGQFMHLSAGGHLQLVPRFTERNFEPGTRFAYSNTGYTLLSLVIERVSGKGWAEFFGERVFAPLGMADTTLLRSDLDIVPNMATLHVPAPGGGWKRGIYPTDDLMGSGGIISTVDDMLAWMAHLRSPEKKVGSAATWKKMLERQSFAGGVSNGYALGLMVEEHRGVGIVHHAGATLGSAHNMLIAPAHELDIVVMSNRLDGPAAGLAIKALEAVLEHEGLGPQVVPAAAADHPALPGRWYSRASKTLIEITARKLRPDWPELLLLSTHNQLVSVLKKSGEGLAMPDGGYSTMEIRRLPQGSAPPASLDVHVCGELEQFDRLPNAPPPVEALAAELCGRYRQPGYAKEFEIALRDGKLVFDFLPLHGRTHWELQPYSDEVIGCGAYHAVPHFPLPNAATLVVERQGGKVSALLLCTDRVRGTRFERC